MTKFEKIQANAKQQGIVVERVGGAEPYEVYSEKEHGHVCCCTNLNEVGQAISEVSQYS